MIIHVLDSNEIPVGVLGNSAPFSCPFFDDLHIENIRTGTNVYGFSVPAGHEMAAKIKTGGKIVFKDLDDRQQMFTIIDVEESNTDSGYVKHVMTEHMAITDLITCGIVRPFKLGEIALDGAVNVVLDGTGYELGEWESSKAAPVEIEEYTSPLDALLQIAELFQVEIQYEVVFKNGQIQKRLIHMKEKLGRVSNKLFHYGKDLQDVTRTENSEALVTALIGVGKGDEDGNQVTLAGYVPTSLPDDFTKNKADDFIVSESAYQAYSKNGKHLFGLYISDSAEDQKTLAEETVKALKARCVPFVSYEMKVAVLERVSGYEADKIRVGDTVNVKDTSMNPVLMVEARILELSRSYTNPENDEVVLGNYRPVKINAYDDVDKIRQALIANEAKWSNSGVSIPEVEEIVSSKVTPIERDLSSLQKDVEGREIQIIRQATKPTGTDYLLGQLWMDDEGILYRWDGESWEKIVKTTAGEIGAVDQSTYTNKVNQLSKDIAGKIGADYVDGKLVLKADKDYVDTALAEKADTDSVNAELAKKASVEYMESQLDLKANTEYVDGKLVLKANAADVYKKTEVDSKVGAKADKVNVYTKTEVDNALDSKVSTTQYTTDQNNVIQRVENAESRITQTEKDITSKVSNTQYSTDMDGLTTKMENHESRITQTEKDITSKVSSTQYTTDMSGLNSTMENHESRITQTEKGIASKVSSSEFTTKISEVEGDIAGINTSLTGKANAADVYKKAEVDTKLGGKADNSRVTAVETRLKDAETAITQTDEKVSLKANATDVYTKTETNTKLNGKADTSTVTALTKRVTDAESELTVQSDKIEARVTKTEFENKVNDVDLHTKLNGVELVDQSYVTDLTAKPFARGTYTVVPYSDIGLEEKFATNLIKVTNSQMLNTDYIPFRPGNPIYLAADVYNAATSNGTFYVGVEFFDKNKVELTSNAATIYGITKTGLTVDKWESLEGYVRTGANGLRTDAAYIRLRILTRWQTQTGVTYLRNVSMKQLGAGFGTLNTLSSHESRITQTEKDITSKVSSTKYTTDMNGVVQDLEDHETRITQTEKDITSKVSSTTYNQKMTAIDGSISTLNTNVDKKANATDVYTKGETDTKLGTKADNSKVTALETRMKDAETAITQTDEKISLKANATDVYTKTETNTKLNGKADTAAVTALETRVKDAESELSVQADKIASKVSTSTYNTKMSSLDGSISTLNTNVGNKADKTAVYTKGETDTKLNAKANNSTVAAMETRLQDAESSITQHDKSIALKANTSDVYTKSQVDTAVGTKADAAAVTDLAKRVTNAEGALEVQAGQIEGKVSLTQYNSDINGTGGVKDRLTKAESKITQTEKDITSKVSTSTYNTDINGTGGLKTRMTSAESKVTQTEKDVTLAFEEINGVKGAINSAVTTIDKNGVTVKDGNFILEDSNSGAKYDVVAKPNLILDHSFELVKTGGSISTSYNWTNIVMEKIYNRSQWFKFRGNARAAIDLDPASPHSGGIFGRQAVAVRNTEEIAQNVMRGVKASTTYTLSAYFRRQSNVVAGGTPMLEAWHIGPDGSRMKLLVKKIFPAVPSNYKIQRHAVTFTTPSTFQSFEGIQVVIGTGNTEWVQVDGVQLVEGSRPSVYQPEDAVWDILNPKETVGYNIRKEGMSLWVGASYMHESQIIYPDKKLSECTNGWILEWQAYSGGKLNRRFSHTHVPKSQGFINSGLSYSVVVPQGDTPADSAFKYLYIKDDSITGQMYNNDGVNRNAVLSAVYEY